MAIFGMAARRIGLAALALAAALGATGAAQAAVGLNGAYYAFNTGPNNVANTLALIGASSGPTATFTATQVCYPSCGGNIGDNVNLSTFLGSGYTGLSNDVTSGLSNHGLDLNGYVNIATAGSQTFQLASDDGSALWIDGALVTNNDGTHAFQETSGTVTLTAGLHSIRILQFENGGNTGLTAKLNGVALSSSILSTSAVPEPASWGMMIAGFGAAGMMLRRRNRTARALA